MDITEGRRLLRAAQDEGAVARTDDFDGDLGIAALQAWVGWLFNNAAALMEHAEALGDLIDALHDELAYEVDQSSEVLAQVMRGCRLLGGPFLPYTEGWL